MTPPTFVTFVAYADKARISSGSPHDRGSASFDAASATRSRTLLVLNVRKDEANGLPVLVVEDMAG
jgi:hypothetical protein